MTEWFFVGLGSTFLTVLVLHTYCLKAEAVEQEDWFKRGVIYAMGVCTILLGFTIWRVMGYGDWELPLGAWAHAIAGGLGFLAGYGLDRVIRAFKNEAKHERRRDGKK